MKTYRAIAALLLLAGCGGRAAQPDSAFAGADSPAQQECRAESRRAPEVQAAWRQVVIGNPTSEERVRRDQVLAESRAYTDCLRRRGLVRGGGVEPLRQPGF